MQGIDQTVIMRWLRKEIVGREHDPAVDMRRQRRYEAVALTALALTLCGLAIDAATYTLGTSGRLVSDVSIVPAALVLAVLGRAIVRRLPGNAIGRVFCLDAFLIGLILLAGAYASGTGNTLAARPGAIAAAWLINPSVGLLIVSLLAVVPLVFPDGRPLSPRFRIGLRLVVVHAAVFTVGFFFLPGDLDTFDASNPIGIETPGNLVGVLTFVCFVLLLPATALGAVSLILRFRRAAGLEREQVKWLLFGALVAVASLSASFVAALVWEVDPYVVSIPLALTVIPLAAGLAVLRYRLYDVDRLISRTIAYGVVTVLLGAVYLALVLFGQVVLSAVVGGGGLAVALSTLVVAALFLPVRARVQALVDRRFNRRHCDAERTLAAFGARLREQLDPELLNRELHGVVAVTLQPASATTWLRRRP